MLVSQYIGTCKKFCHKNITANGGLLNLSTNFQQTINEHKQNTDIKQSPGTGNTNKPKEQNRNRHVLSFNLCENDIVVQKEKVLFFPYYNK